MIKRYIDLILAQNNVEICDYRIMQSDAYLTTDCFLSLISKYRNQLENYELIESNIKSDKLRCIVSLYNGSSAIHIVDAENNNLISYEIDRKLEKYFKNIQNKLKEGINNLLFISQDPNRLVSLSNKIWHHGSDYAERHIYKKDFTVVIRLYPPNSSFFDELTDEELISLSECKSVIYSIKVSIIDNSQDTTIFSAKLENHIDPINKSTYKTILVDLLQSARSELNSKVFKLANFAKNKIHPYRQGN
jgi:hypothetical protein